MFMEKYVRSAMSLAWLQHQPSLKAEVPMDNRRSSSDISNDGVFPFTTPPAIKGGSPMTIITMETARL